MSGYPKHPLHGATIDRLAWMAGRWASVAERDRLEEIWSPPDGGIMIGMFRWIRGDAVSLYEFLVLKPGPAGLELHIKHFAPDLVGWEEKDATIAFDLVQLGDREAVFAPRAEDHSGWAVYRIAADGWLEFEEVSEREAPESALFLRFAPACRPRSVRLDA